MNWAIDARRTLRNMSSTSIEEDPARSPATQAETPFALLIAALHDENVRIRRFAADVLGEMGDTQAVDPLIDGLNDADHLVRQNAIISLAKLGDERAIDPLIAMLHDNDKFTRWIAVNALNEMGDPQSVELLQIVLEDDRDQDVREAAREALQAHGYTL